MSTKRDKFFFQELQQQSFEVFMHEYWNAMHEMIPLINKSYEGVVKGKRHSVHLHYKIRQKSVEIEKFGSAFRARTIEMQKCKTDDGVPLEQSSDTE